MRTIVSKVALTVAVVSSLAFAETEFEKWQREQNEALKSFQEKNKQEFEAWEAQRRKELQDFQNGILKKWGDYTEPKKEKWVEYSNDGNSKSVVDFEKGQVTVEVIVEAGDDADDKLSKAVEKVLESKGSTSHLPIEAKKGEVTASDKPILEGIVKDKDGKALTEENKSKFIKNIVKKEAVVVEKKVDTTKTVVNDKITSSKDPSKVVKKKVVKVTFPLIPNYLQKKMKPYVALVKKYAKKYGVKPNHVLATIHTESYFNPAAKSHVGAIGLMQLMPNSGGRDAYKYVTGKTSRPTLEYLYKPENNIMLGCAYIKILETSYFKKITKEKSRRYCAIAGYNTGAGNVAKTFNGNIGRKKGMYSVKKATPTINAMTDEQVYAKLYKDLPYEETRGYLKKVSERMNIYGSVTVE